MIILQPASLQPAFERIAKVGRMRGKFQEKAGLFYTHLCKILIINKKFDAD